MLRLKELNVGITLQIKLIIELNFLIDKVNSVEKDGIINFHPMSEKLVGMITKNIYSFKHTRFTEIDGLK